MQEVVVKGVSGVFAAKFRPFPRPSHFLLPPKMAAAVIGPPAKSRLLALTRLRCNIFSTLYNPTSARTGAKYLRARLRGPSLVNYYPQTVSFREIDKKYPELKLINFDEEQRLADIEDRKARGKGAPKKAKSAGRLLSTRSSVVASQHNTILQRTADVWRRRRERSKLGSGPPHSFVQGVSTLRRRAINPRILTPFLSASIHQSRSTRCFTTIFYRYERDERHMATMARHDSNIERKESLSRSSERGKQSRERTENQRE